MEATGYNFYNFEKAQESPKMALPSLTDPSSKIIEYLQNMGINISSEELYNAEDYPVLQDTDALRHFFLGAGGPFVEFLTWVDIGVGWITIPHFDDLDLGNTIKNEFDQFCEDSDIIGTLVGFVTFFYVLGRACIVITRNAAGTDFYINKNIGLTGIDNIDVLTLDEESIRKSLKDPTGNTPFKQNIELDIDTPPEIQQSSTIPIARERVIFRTRNPLSKVSHRGISLFQNCSKDLDTAARFPRYRNQLSSKYANLHRHYVVNTEMLRNIEGGLDILSTKEAQDEYLYGIWEMLREQMEKGATIVTFDFIDSRDISFGGNEPDLGGIEKQTYEAIGFKTGVPLNLTGLYGGEVNRATLDTMAQFFVDRRKNGPQKIFVDIVREIINIWMDMKGYKGKGTLEVKVNPFLNETEEQKAHRALLLEQSNIPRSAVEKRRVVGLGEKIEEGEADRQAENMIDIETRQQNKPRPKKVQEIERNPQPSPEALNVSMEMEKVIKEALELSGDNK